MAKARDPRVRIRPLREAELPDNASNAIRPRKRTDRRMTRVLEVLAEGLSLKKASIAAGISKTTVDYWRKHDPSFAQEVLDAIDQGTERLEDEALRRAVDGVERPIYNKDGDLKGTEKLYSDNLLMFMLKARKPATYREPKTSGNAQVFQGDVTINMTNKDDAAL